MAEHTPIEIKPQQQPSRISTECNADDLLSIKDQKVPFFRPLSERRGSAWIISLFVFLHVIAFAATMLVNDCWRNSHGDCAIRFLGRFSFQPLPENPLLGPSASALDEMGALRKTLLVNDHEIWRLFTSPWLHSGVFHLIINLTCILFVGIHLEQEFGPLRIGVIYILSAITGSMGATLCLQDRPTVTSSGALFGLLGTMISGLTQNWRFYTKKIEALRIFFFILTMNIGLGLLPYVNNFSSIGGFLSGFLLGLVLLFRPKLEKMVQSEGGIFDYDTKHSARLRQKPDRPVQRSVSLLIFILLLAGITVAVLHGINANKSCPWCRFFDCVPSKWWTCNDKPTYCETMVSEGRLTLTCSHNDKFRVFPFANVSQARLKDLCNWICA